MGTATSKQPTLRLMQTELIFSQADSPANHSPQLASAKERKMIATSGRRCLEQYGKLSPGSSWAKTFLGSLIGMEGWYSSRSRLRWRLRATKSSSLICQLSALTLSTSAAGYGLLPTVKSCSNENRQSDGYGPNLGMALGLLPTPVAIDSGTWRMNISNSPNAQERPSLALMAKNGLLPTPCAQDGGNSSLPESQRNRDTVPGWLMGVMPTPQANEGEHITGLENQDSITKRLRHTTGGRFMLSHRFTLAMMGFPPDWTEAAFLQPCETLSPGCGDSPSKAAEMP